MSALLVDLESFLAGQGVLWGYAEIAGCFPHVPAYPRAVSLACPLPADALAGLEAGPTPAYYTAYQSVNVRLNDLTRVVTDLITSHGWPSLACPATVSQAQLDAMGSVMQAPVPHKTAATRAALGWIGKNALLITRQHGPRVRLATVLTQAPLPVAQPVTASRCGKCTRCVQACPAAALHGETWHPGVARERLVDVDACARTARELLRQRVQRDDTVCGICIAVCPFGR